MESTTFITAVALTTGLTQVLKMSDAEGKLSRWYPLMALVLGTVIGLVAKLEILMAITVGLSAIGVYSGVKKTVEK